MTNLRVMRIILILAICVVSTQAISRADVNGNYTWKDPATQRYTITLATTLVGDLPDNIQLASVQFLTHSQDTEGPFWIADQLSLKNVDMRTGSAQHFSFINSNFQALRSSRLETVLSGRKPYTLFPLGKSLNGVATRKIGAVAWKPASPLTTTVTSKIGEDLGFQGSFALPQVIRTESINERSFALPLSFACLTLLAFAVSSKISILLRTTGNRTPMKTIPQTYLKLKPSRSGIIPRI